RYGGERKIAFDDLGIVPFRALKRVAQKNFRERLTLRERSILKLGVTGDGIWEYDGPVMFTGKVVFRSKSWRRPDVREVVMDTSRPIAAETSIILLGLVGMDTLPDLEGVCVDVGYMKPVIWDLTPLPRHSLQASEQILDGVQSFERPGDVRSSQLRHRVGATFTIRLQSSESVAIPEEFIRILSLYPGVIFVCLRHEDEVDSMYQKMKPNEIRLDEE
ncbi:hypothetical protein CMUS01_16244, partial [Colletotrichum musicola]